MVIVSVLAVASATGLPAQASTTTTTSARTATVDSTSASAAVAPATSAVAPAVAAAAGSDPAHLYSFPTYFPLRNPAKVSCVYSNCPGKYHGHWAINYIGHKDDPIYAIGAGIFHIGGIAPKCGVSKVTQGTWVYVDHGAGGVTRYMHLDKVVATEGEHVTPDTVIGLMGGSGNTNCTTAYTDIEWRAVRVAGTREPIPTMSACQGYSVMSLPKALGYTSWNSMPYNKITTPQFDNSCHPTWNQTPNRPTVTPVRSGSGTILVKVSARPAGTTAVRVWMEEYHPSLHAYDSIPTLRDISVTHIGTHFGHLLNGRTYRFSVAYKNSAGWSNWAVVKYLAPAA